MAAASLSLSSLTSSLMPKPSLHKNPSSVSSSLLKTRLSFLSHSLSSLSLHSQQKPTLSSLVKATDAAVAEAETETEAGVEIEAEPSVVEEAAEEEAKREEVFAVVMVGSRQYIVFPGRYIYTQRLKGANVDDKITLNKVLLVGTKTSTWIGKPIVPNATVHAIVEEQTKDKKVIVFKYKKKKNYRRNIGHRQPITRIRITSIDGYQDSPAVTLTE